MGLNQVTGGGAETHQNMEAEGSELAPAVRRIAPYSDPGPSSVASAVSENQGPMEVLGEELLRLIFTKLSLADLIRVRAVCCHWRKLDGALLTSPTGRPSYCPLVFKREYNTHQWEGYDATTGRWAPLPPLPRPPPAINLLPVAGSGKGFLGFKVITDLSGYVVGDPSTRSWKTLPRSPDVWGEAGMFMVVDKDRKRFRIIGIREEETQMYNSESDSWRSLDGKPPESVSLQTLAHIKSKQCASLCNGRLYSRSNDFLVSFDVWSEQWTNEVISIPNMTQRSRFLLVECAGNLYAVVEHIPGDIIAVWGLGLESRRFTPLVEMPEDYFDFLSKSSWSRARIGKLRPAAEPAQKSRSGCIKSVAHNHQIFFWRHKKYNIIAFDLLTRTWSVLPEIQQSDTFDEVTVDMGFFEPTGCTSA